LSLENVSALQEIIVKSGALNEVENLITDLTSTAISALQDSPVDGKIAKVLEEMAIIATQRSV
jgi:geranylgeranyl pyrophosphate synthase